MTNNYLYDLSVKLFDKFEYIMSFYINNWNELSFSYKAAHLFWITIAFIFYVLFYNLLLYLSIKFYIFLKSEFQNEFKNLKNKEE
ncbi:MAG: hypothetical protein K2X69_00995 [Silvanigrellaceae bacterium]|nr:hypothetical protein [Silvanigrellaceae bacterium]